MALKGKIIVNPFGIPGQNMHQAKRLKEEFAKQGVVAQIMPQAFLYAQIQDNDLELQLGDLDFIIFLDKDKYLSGIIDKKGIRCFNTHSAIRLCDDKGETYIALAGKGVNLPKTQFAPICYDKSCEISQEQIDTIEQKLGYPMIVKSSYGSCGSGVYKVEDRKSLIEISEKLKLTPHMFQEYLGKEVGKDIRVIVIGGKAVAAMTRYNEKDFRSNIALGGKGEKIDINDNAYKQVLQTAEKVATILGLDYCGVDILKGNNGEPVICEVNSNAFFEGIEKVTSVNVAKAYVEYVIKQLTE